MTLPPTFPVDYNSPLDEATKAFVKRITAPVFSKALKEATQNQPLVGGVGSKKSRIVYLQPHSYRLYFDFNKLNFDFFSEEKPTQGNQGVGLLFPLEHKWVNTTELFIKFKDFTVRVKQRTVCITNLFEHKRLYSIDTSQNIDKQLKACAEIAFEKNRQCLGFLRAFIGQYGGSSDYKVQGVPKIDIKHFDERLEELLPLRARWYNDANKKEYMEKTIETHDWLFTANLLRNMSVVDIAPAIAAELREIKEKLSSPGISTLRDNEPVAHPPQSVLGQAGASFFDYQPAINFLVEKCGQDRKHCEIFFGVRPLG